jgi:hypothetical protein
MLVPSMTPEEVYAEVLRDSDNLLRKSNAKSFFYQDQLKRKGMQRELRREEYETPHHNKWTMQYTVFPTQTLRAFYTHAMDSRGHVVYGLDFINSDTKKIEVVKYNGHFWKRYRERSHPELTKQTDLVKSFFNHNRDFDRGVKQELEDGSLLLAYVTNEGMSIGWHLREKKFVHMKTFLSHDMLNKNQQSLVDYILQNGDVESFLTTVKEEHLKNNPDSISDIG